MLDQLRTLAASQQPAWVRDRAVLAIQIESQFAGGGLDLGEYQELMRDLVRVDRLDAEASDIELKTALITAVYAVAQLA